MGRHKLETDVHERRANWRKPKHGTAKYQRWYRACVELGRETRFCKVGEVSQPLWGAVTAGQCRDT